jgi:hypothetical protein
MMRRLFPLLSFFLLTTTSPAQDLPKEMQEMKKFIKQWKEEFQQRMRETLHGVKSLSIHIAYSGDLYYDHDNDPSMAFYKELDNFVTHKLKNAGIEVKLVDDNTFHINLTTYKKGNGVTFYAIRINFFQPILIKNKPSIEQIAPTWWKYKWDETEQNALYVLKNEIDDITNTFLVDYLLANSSNK